MRVRVPWWARPGGDAFPPRPRLELSVDKQDESVEVILHDDIKEGCGGPGPDDRRVIRNRGSTPADRIPLTPTAAILLAVSFGLFGGYLDVGVISFKKYCWNQEGTFELRGISSGPCRRVTPSCC